MSECITTCSLSAKQWKKVLQVNLSARSLQLHTMVPCGYGAVHTMAWSADSTSLVAVCDKSEAAPGAVTPPAPDTVVLQCQPGSPSPSPITTGPGSINAVVWTLDGKHIVSVDRGQHLVSPCAFALTLSAAVSE